jgi:hypothetical protein
LHAQGRPGPVVELEPTLLADPDRCRQFDERGVTRRRGGRCPGSPLQAVIIEAKRGGGRADPVRVGRPANSQSGRGIRSPNFRSPRQA